MTDIIPPPPLERTDSLPEIFRQGRYLLYRRPFASTWTIAADSARTIPLLLGWRVSFNIPDQYVLATPDETLELSAEHVIEYGGRPLRFAVDDTGTTLGSICRPLFIPLGGALLEILDPDDAVIVRLHEVDITLAMMRQLLGNWVPQRYRFLTPEGTEVGHCARTTQGFELDLGDPWHSIILDPRLALMAMLMTAL